MKFRIFFAALALLFSAWGATAQEPQLVDETVARVNTDIITRSMLVKAQLAYKEELKRRMPNDEAKQKEEYDKLAGGLLDILIEDRLISQRATELSIDVEPQINTIILEAARETNPNMSLKEFEDALKAQGIDIEEVRRNYRTQLQREALFYREVLSPIYDKVTDEEKREWYNKNTDRLRLPGEIKISEIFIPFEGRSEAEALALAKQVVAEARSGKPFPELARVYSDSKRLSAQKGGELPPFKDTEIIEYLRKLVETMKVGDVSEPVKTDKGFQIIRLNEYKAASVRDFAEVEKVATEQVAFEKGQNQFKDYLKGLRDKAYVRIAEAYKQQVAVKPN